MVIEVKNPSGLRITKSDTNGIFLHFKGDKKEGGIELNALVENLFIKEVVVDWVESCISTTISAKLDKKKVGMYGETPKVTIGNFTICEMTLPAGDSIWIERPEEEGGEFKKSLLEPMLKEFFDKHL